MLDEEFFETLSEFYRNLLDSQESLGEEFSEILYENLWDFYVKS